MGQVRGARAWRRVGLLVGVLALMAPACSGTPGGERSDQASTDEHGHEHQNPADVHPGAEGEVDLTVARGWDGHLFLPLDVAMHQGFFTDRGLSVSLVETHGDAAIAAGVAGDVDVMLTLPELPVAARARGGDLRLIGATVDENLFRLYAVEGVESLNDLAGAKVAMHHAGAAPDIQMRMLLDEAGVGSDNVSYVDLGEPPARLSALQSGQVSAALLAPPTDVEADQAGLHPAGELVEHVDSYPIVGISASETTLSEKGGAVEKFLAGIAEGAAYINDQPDQAAAIASEAYALDPDVAREGLDRVAGSYALDVAIDPQGLDWMLGLMDRYADLPEVPSAEEVYDPSYLP